jgi:hypothetical protein
MCGPEGAAGGPDGIDAAGRYGLAPGGVAPAGTDPAGTDPAGPAECGWGGATGGPAGAAVGGPGGVTRGEPASTIVPGASMAVNLDHAPDQPSRVRGQLSSGCDTDSPAGQIP